jgi:signal transduction histidine kinase
MSRVFWLIRVSGFALIGILALISPARSADEQAVQIACFSAVGLALLLWGAADLSPRYRTWGLPVALGVIAVAGGVAGVTTGSGQSLVAFTFVAASWAASDADSPVWIAVTASGLVSIWVAGGLTGASFGTMVGYPLATVVCLLIGLSRRSYRVRAEQSAALLAQQELLRAEQRRGDVLDERARIAREIHDVLAHSLGALGIQIQAAKAILTDQGDVDRAVEALTAAQRMAADGLTETRRAVHALRVDTLPLGDELAAAVDTYRQRYHVPATLKTSGTPRAVPPDGTVALLRTAQEAMVNAAKHAPGQQVTVRLDYGENDVRLSVVNPLDGVGELPRNGAGALLQRPGSSGGGYGLTGLRERLRLLNGTLLAGPRENPGEDQKESEWAVTAELPLAAAKDGIAE